MQRWDTGERERVSKAQRFYRGLGAADWLGKGRGLGRLAGERSESCYAGRWACFNQEVCTGEREVIQGEEARSEVSAIFPEKGSCRRHSHSKWRTQNKMESAGVGLPFQRITEIQCYISFRYTTGIQQFCTLLSAHHSKRGHHLSPYNSITILLIIFLCCTFHPLDLFITGGLYLLSPVPISPFPHPSPFWQLPLCFLKSLLVSGHLGGSFGLVSDSWFQLWSWSHSLRVWAPHQALQWQWGACLGFLVSLSFCPSLTHACCLSKINKFLKKSLLVCFGKTFFKGLHIEWDLTWYKVLRTWEMSASHDIRIPDCEITFWGQVSELFLGHHKLCPEIGLLVTAAGLSLLRFSEHRVPH